MKVLLLSHRQIATLVAYCLSYEFEDTFAAVTNAQLIEVTDLPGLEFSRRAYKLARRASGSAALARQLVPYPRGKVNLERSYDLFFPVFSHSYQLYALATVPAWRERCKKAACFITEIGSNALPEYLIELLSDFDHIFLGTRYGVEDIARISGRPCTYLPLAVDVPRFTPASRDQQRPIYISNIGRRSPVTHQALLKETELKQSFYYYDTVAASGGDLKHRTFRVDNPREHRRMLATILKHSNFFIANRGYVNKPASITDRDEIAARFYEGAAAGTVMIGEAPHGEAFKKQFDWPDAVTHMPFDCPDIGRILSEMNGNSEDLRTTRRRNAREAALRHDWLHRIQVVFDTLGLARTEQMRARAEQLEQIASQA